MQYLRIFLGASNTGIQNGYLLSKIWTTFNW